MVKRRINGQLKEAAAHPALRRPLDSIASITDESTGIHAEFYGAPADVCESICEFISKANCKDDIELIWREAIDAEDGDEVDYGDVILDIDSYSIYLETHGDRFLSYLATYEWERDIRQALGLHPYGTQEFIGDSQVIVNESFAEALDYNDWPNVDITGKVIK